MFSFWFLKLHQIMFGLQLQSVHKYDPGCVFLELRHHPALHPSPSPGGVPQSRRVCVCVCVSVVLGGPRHFRRAAALNKSCFKAGPVVSCLLMRCEQVWTGPRRGPRPVSTAWAAVGGWGRNVLLSDLYNYVSFVRAWSVSTAFVCQELHPSAGMLSVWVLTLLSRSHQRSHNVPVPGVPGGHRVVHSLPVASHR